MKTKICINCFKEYKKKKDWSFNYYDKSKFCCRECYLEYNKSILTHKCDYCGKEHKIYPYELKTKNKLYCSNDCKNLDKQIGCGITTDGYVWILIGRKQVKLHRYLMEIKLGRKLSPNEIVHHIDFNKLNNSINNLMIVTRTQHNKIHKFLEGHD